MNLCDIVDPHQDMLWTPGIWGVAVGSVFCIMTAIVTVFQFLGAKIKISKYVPVALLALQIIFLLVHISNYNAYNDWYSKGKHWLDENCDESTNYHYAMLKNITIDYKADPDDKALVRDLIAVLSVFVAWDVCYVLYQYRYLKIHENYHII